MPNYATTIENQYIQPDSQVEYGIVFCITGKELTVAQRLEKNIQGLTALAPVKLRYRRVSGIAQEESVILFPGYVFIRVGESVEASDILQEPYVLKLLKTDPERRSWRLYGQDRDIIASFFQINGVIGFSRAYYDERDRIHIVDGFLANHEGQILRVNKRAKTAEICIEIAGKTFKLWLGYESIT